MLTHFNKNNINNYNVIKNHPAGNAYWDPAHNSLFEVNFYLPSLLVNRFAGDECISLLPFQITTISGLDALQKTVSAGEQKFLGASYSFLNPTLDNTYADITIEFNLNIRNATDAFILRIFKAWRELGYNLQTGQRLLMADYICPQIDIYQANRDGSIWRTIQLQRIMLTGVTGLDSLDYTSNEPVKISATFRCDYWDETLTEPIAKQ